MSRPRCGTWPNLAMIGVRTMSTNCKTRAVQFVVLATLLVPVIESFGEEMIIKDVRPVAAAAEKFEEQFHVPITYEDPPYLFASDIEDVRAKIARPESLAAGKGLRVVMGMKERELRFAFVPALTSKDQQAAIQKAVEANN